MATRLAVALSCAASAMALSAAGGGKVTPVEKVIELLKKLEAKTEVEGKEEAVAYDKYACFCKEQADNKLYAIKRSDQKIEKLAAQTGKLEADLATLAAEIGALATRITELTAQIEKADEIREKEHAQYAVEEEDISKAIDACSRALDALKESKGALGGKVDLEDAFVQVRAFAGLALKASASTSRGLSRRQADAIAALAAAGQPGKAYQYEYHANDIVATLADLHTTFKENKKELDTAEFEAKADYDKKRLALSNEQKFAEKEKAEKEVESAAKTEEHSAAVADRTQEANERDSDQSFLDVVTNDCQDKAVLFDQRSKVRAGELTAISEALTTLESGVKPNYKANKKLFGLQKGFAPMLPNGHVEGHQAPKDATAFDAARPASFLQLRGLRGAAVAGKRTAAQRAVQLLAASAERLGSPLLSMAALKARASEDHFVKVRQIIKDLVTRLEADAAAEATQKSFCDKSMKKEITNRDEQQSLIETHTADISSKESEKAQLLDEIATLSNEIVDLKKALTEAAELREEENKENEATIESSGAGKEAVEHALKVLKEFYGGNAFVQVGKYVPPNSDREGNTVGDLAPEVFDIEYRGNQQASKGILGLLEVILTDFDRTTVTVAKEEAEAQEKFEAFEKETETSIKKKEADIKTKEGKVSDIEDALVEFQDELQAAEEAHSSSLEALQKLEKMCVVGEETYEERVAQRKKEIEALKEAHAILENWQD